MVGFCKLNACQLNKGEYADRCPGFDDVIYPVDYRTAGHIVDDEMHDIMLVSSIPSIPLTN